ncbi:bifunctional 2',3'-cyclic-nucleotide 2'-phosphodiesterase/3'-nucleotidase [Alkalihalobacillus sp. 1P02AB]
MKINKFLSTCLVVLIIFNVFTLTMPRASAETGGGLLNLRIMETTDLHVHLVNYDYYRDELTDEYGLAKTATLIKQAREEVKNSLLFDNGDLIQGNPLGDYMANIKGLEEGEIHPVYKAMNLLDYDAGNIGNHEFNYGLDFLEKTLNGSNFPYVNANVYFADDSEDKNYFTPYLILDRMFVDQSGEEHALKIGVIGFVPPQIMQWDKAHLEGKVIAKDIVETAEKFIPQMKEEGADLIIAIPHSGFEKGMPKEKAENAVGYLSTVDGIDAILFGHSHSVFPGQGFDDIEGIDNQKGTINGVPSVMPGFWGNHLGVIDLVLEQVDGEWKVVDSQSSALPVFDSEERKALVEADQGIVEAVKHEHEGTLEYVRGDVGETTDPIHSYFSLVQDDPSIQIVTNAQRWYVEKYIQGTDYEGIPVLSAGAPFKAGGRGGPDYYTDIEEGTIAIKNVADLYVYPNTLMAVLLDGAQVKEWIEMSAGQFKQIDPNTSEEQVLLNPEFPSYNYDVMDGVTYQIDITQPPKYDPSGNVVNPDSNRIVNLLYEGQEITAEQQFIVATNNYRATGGGNFPDVDGSNIIIEFPDESRQIVIEYIFDQQTINPSADNNWTFAPIKSDVLVTFESSPSAKSYAEQMEHIQYLGTLDNGFSKYSIELSVGDQELIEEQLEDFKESSRFLLIILFIVISVLLVGGLVWIGISRKKSIK